MIRTRKRYTPEEKVANSERAADCRAQADDVRKSVSRFAFSRLFACAAPPFMAT